MKITNEILFGWSGTAQIDSFNLNWRTQALAIEFEITNENGSCIDCNYCIN